MRILYIDIDSLRPDHLGCYGYHRDTSPNIDRIAARGLCLDNCHASDVPCLPSRTAMFSGRHGIHTGVINHGGAAADPMIEGKNRCFRSTQHDTAWPTLLQDNGYRTVMFSSFGQRHSAMHIYAGFNEIWNCGLNGNEEADDVVPTAIDWIEQNGASDDWFMHLNVWDPHSLYTTPDDFGDPFADAPLPAWYDEEERDKHWNGPGPHSAQEVPGYRPDGWDKFSANNARQRAKRRWALSDKGGEGIPRRQPRQIESMTEARRLFDGYDTSVRYVDHWLGKLFDKLEALGLLDETVIMITADHGENLGELNIYGDHQTADQITSRIPMIVHWPGVTDARSGEHEPGFCYHFDMAATALELLDIDVPAVWDGTSFASQLRTGGGPERPYLVLSQGAWSCQRSVRFDDYICIRSYHDGYHDFPDIMLFDLKNDPHEQHDIAADHPEVVGRAMIMLDEWYGRMMRSATHGHDPMWTVMNEGGPLHTRDQLPSYLERLRATGRGKHADSLASKHPEEASAVGDVAVW